MAYGGEASNNVYNVPVQHFSHPDVVDGKTYRYGDKENNVAEQIKEAAPIVATRGDESCPSSIKLGRSLFPQEKKCRACRDKSKNCEKDRCKCHTQEIQDVCRKTCGVCGAGSRGKFLNYVSDSQLLWPSKG